ncbi:cytidylyltransferase family protein [Xylariales sp. AK1849]|nr:cytidylyltransferase family protein [Xylariales sp. AK1849]
MYHSPDGSLSRQLSSGLVSNFTRSLKTFQLSKTTFSILCTLPSQSEPAPVPPRQAVRNLLVLDSSFNPPTLAHKRMALSTLSEDRYSNNSRVLLLLATNNADKAPKPAAFPQRLAMMYIFALDLLSAVPHATAEVDIAVTTEPYFHSKSNAIATSDFYSKTDTSSATQQVYLTGFDTLIRIFDPKYYPDNSMKQALEPFFSHSRIRVNMRTNADWGDSEEQIGYLEGLRRGQLEEAGGKKEWANKVEMVEGTQVGEEVISSTKVRDAVRNEDWESLRKLVAKGVTDWIRDEGLYREDAS